MVCQLFAILPPETSPACPATLPCKVAGLAVGGDGSPPPHGSFAGCWIYAGDFWTAETESSATDQQRQLKLVKAAKAYDLILLDGVRDLEPAVLASVPAEKRILARRCHVQSLAELRRDFEALAQVPARYYLLITRARRPGDALLPLRLMKDLGRQDVIAYAEGIMGAWSRVLAPFLGAPLTFAPLADNNETGPSIAQLINDYALPCCPQPEVLYGIAGTDVSRSQSPRRHNMGYREVGLAALYLPFSAASFEDLHHDLLADGTLDVLGLQIQGLTVTAPFKEAALAMATVSDEITAASGGANMLVRRSDGWLASTSDAIGAIGTLARRGIDIRDKPVAVIGCGGAGRAAAIALHNAGARVTLVNRDPKRGQVAANDLKLPFQALDFFDPSGFSLLVQATPAGRKGGPAPFDITRAHPSTTLIEYLYGEEPSRLTLAARARGLTVIDGYEVLQEQIYAQFSFLTGCYLPDFVAYATTD